MMYDPQFKHIGYPIGHPKVHVVNKNVDWQDPRDNPYKLALLKVFLIPPRECDVPVMPVKFEKDDRLLFPLCASCAQQLPEGGLDLNDDYSCHHNDTNRGWVNNLQ
jgi:hypothetical protein